MTAAPDPGDELESALAQAAASLETGDLDAAALAMTAAAACTTRGALTPEVIASARLLFDRCQRAEAALRRSLLDALGQAGSSRRAHNAYDR
jgi:hypothetical protein